MEVLYFQEVVLCPLSLGGFRAFNLCMFWQFKEPNIQSNMDGFAEKQYQHRASSIDGKIDKPGNPEAL